MNGAEFFVYVILFVSIFIGLAFFTYIFVDMYKTNLDDKIWGVWHFKHVANKLYKLQKEIKQNEIDEMLIKSKNGDLRWYLEESKRKDKYVAKLALEQKLRIMLQKYATENKFIGKEVFIKDDLLVKIYLGNAGVNYIHVESEFYDT